MGLRGLRLRSRASVLPAAGEPAAAPDFVDRLSSHVAQSLAREYANGVCDGFRTTLRLLLGETADGAEPYRGPVPPELERWARAGLDRLAKA